MCEKDDKGIVPYTEMSRRAFAVLAASAVAGMASGADAQAAVTEKT